MNNIKEEKQKIFTVVYSMAHGNYSTPAATLSAIEKNQHQ